MFDKLFKRMEKLLDFKEWDKEFDNFFEDAKKDHEDLFKTPEGADSTSTETETTETETRPDGTIVKRHIVVRKTIATSSRRTTKPAK